MNLLPRARNIDIVVQSLSHELLIYDLKTHQAYQLNETSMIVFQACGDKQTFADLRGRYRFSEDLIHLTLDKLNDAHLIEDYQSELTGISRREVVRKVGLASVITLPVISVLVAPHPAQAASGSCTINGACIPSGQNLCAGCAGRAVTFDRYNANSNCQGSTFTPQTIACPASGSSFVSPFTDRIRTAVT